MSAENVTTYGNVADRHHQKSGSKDTFFKTTIHIGVFKIWKCKQCDSFLQHSFVNRIPCRMECATQLPTVSFITHAHCIVTS